MGVSTLGRVQVVFKEGGLLRQVHIHLEYEEANFLAFVEMIISTMRFEINDCKDSVNL